jgi:hypothetical protein
MFVSGKAVIECFLTFCDRGGVIWLLRNKVRMRSNDPKTVGETARYVQFQ